MQRGLEVVRRTAPPPSPPMMPQTRPARGVGRLQEPLGSAQSTHGRLWGRHKAGRGDSRVGIEHSWATPGSAQSTHGRLSGRHKALIGDSGVGTRHSWATLGSAQSREGPPHTTPTQRRERPLASNKRLVKAGGAGGAGGPSPGTWGAARGLNGGAGVERRRGVGVGKRRHVGATRTERSEPSSCNMSHPSPACGGGTAPKQAATAAQRRAGRGPPPLTVESAPWPLTSGW